MMLPVFRAAVARGLRSSGGKYSSALGAVGYPRHAPNLTFGESGIKKKPRHLHLIRLNLHPYLRNTENAMACTTSPIRRTTSTMIALTTTTH
ncbi:hypothetical protein AtNW77_Chr3g0176481 [Arabidopsis thaliana]|uniref:Uncharacterized protein n=2 Tax=Arabidopsis TaxID=3701 RepID=A0A8T2F740_ARASU|nr:hypothetical protein ISN45_At03g019050 [Arabidopsis thaliana x Arabidopsis arenosa]KAG7631692.1 hypothetical protein ISN44_As03g019010 [Arabidopsis suecica]